MNLLILGATGRVGSEAVLRAVAAGHNVTAFVRDPARLAAAGSGVKLAAGDLTKPETVAAALSGGIEAVVNAVGVDPLKPSTFVTDAARTVVAAMLAAKVNRYVAVSGTAQMPTTWFGALTIALLRRTPVKHAIRDHDGAFAIVAHSPLDWTLAGCPYIRDGRAKGNYVRADKFPGGFKTIVPGDVAAFLIEAVARTGLSRRIIGIWN
jgi:putative NADH-flavin reductase